MRKCGVDGEQFTPEKPQRIVEKRRCVRQTDGQTDGQHGELGSDPDKSSDSDSLLDSNPDPDFHPESNSKLQTVCGVYSERTCSRDTSALGGS